MEPNDGAVQKTALAFFRRFHRTPRRGGRNL